MGQACSSELPTSNSFYLASPPDLSPPEPMYTMLLSVPLEGPLEKGGVIFVLRSGNVGQNTSWLKVCATPYTVHA